jgi:CO dehydrogenase/acetyl-CoA synthase delta subunit
MSQHYIVDFENISGFSIPKVSTVLRTKDYLGTIMVRWGFKRDNYKVGPGLYAVGIPRPDSDVFVTANYKLSFDTLRRNLSGINAWILVLDTKGINVWCAAGKGTFGTKELINRVRDVSLEKIVNHRRLILPQLGATGVAAHEFKKETGFNIIYGPVRANDIKSFVDNGYRADKKMRKVTFNFSDRLKLVPNDFMYGKYYLLGAIAVISLISCLTKNGLSFNNLLRGRVPSILNVLFAYISGIVITPLLLPYLPARQFSIKGFYTGVIFFIFLSLLKLTGTEHIEVLSWFFIITSVSSFMAMNFTGSSTFTSLSGVKKEMKNSVPFQIGFGIVGIVLQVVGKFI